LYGDPAYYLAFGIMGAYRSRQNRPLPEPLKQMNSLMSSMRVSVEHGFAKVMTLWSFNGFKGDLRVGLSPVGAYFMIAVLFANIHTCFNGSQTGYTFNCAPPTLEEYI
ncbi:hypothetical protein EDC01DRAFT_594529, partial [Geopyxis carbonaria]